MKNVLISFSKASGSEVLSLKKLLSEKGYILRDASSKTDCLDYLIEQGKIAKDSQYDLEEVFRLCTEWAELLIVFIDKDSNENEDMCNMVEIAHRGSKDILGVMLSDIDEDDIPESLKKYANKGLIKSDDEQIIDAIEKEVEVWQEVSGQARTTPLGKISKPKSCK
ncbi:hypothetical protein [Fibrella forsythiae]|uniref:TIR domain-containing protein n=1 Tax=Fibrella forsythiae TaxID=2817061 RepID=A0ABS3JSU9_9BACT|nr:hypothetical protein [Fibrella forsythiae]MBO0953080.1 hypothetical protein [Fibrella forsythiae]